LQRVEIQKLCLETRKGKVNRLTHYQPSLLNPSISLLS
jgi:hypothetical protein